MVIPYTMSQGMAVVEGLVVLYMACKGLVQLSGSEADMVSCGFC